jgi:signal transduction histidine kinase
MLGVAVLALIYALAASSSYVFAVQARPASRPALLVSPPASGASNTTAAAAPSLPGGPILRPLRTITATAHTISAGNLHERLALAGPDDEFKRLADTLDDLLARLEASFEAQRRFVANASHDLRTPLTLERALL